MLKTPAALIISDPILNAITDALSNGRGVKIIEEGVVEIGHFSLDMMVWGNNGPYEYGYPWFDAQGDDQLHSYGVCDTPEQFLGRYRKLLQDDERTFVMSFTHIHKEPENKGQGGGWRWHKWGPYIGTGEPTMEYLDDEEKFENGVYVYHILQTDGPVKKTPWDRS